MQASSALTLEEGVLLGHALVNGVAERAGARVLFIKGPALTRTGLRPARQSVDVDALVHPRDFERLLAALNGAEWDVRVVNTSARILERHSTTIWNPKWPCEIDLHCRFPGFFAPPEVVFDVLWARRARESFGGHRVPVCDMTGSALIGALHSARTPRQKSAELQYLIDGLRARMAPADLRDLAELAAATGATAALGSFLAEVGAPRIPSAWTTEDALRQWHLATATEGTRAVVWLHHLRQTPLRRLLPELWHALVFTDAEIRLIFPQARPGRLGLWQARWWRLRRALRHLPRAIHLLRTADRRRGLD